MPILPVRLKIILLLAAALTLTLVSLLFTSSTLFVDDKTSYILEENLNRTKGAARLVDNQLGQTLMLLRVMNARNNEKGDRSDLKKLFQEGIEKHGWKQVLTLKIGKSGELIDDLAMGDTPKAISQKFFALGWTGPRLASERVLIQSVGVGEIAIGTMAVTPENVRVAYVAFLSLQMKSFESLTQAEVLLLDSLGNVVFSTRPQKATRKSFPTAALDFPKVKALMRQALSNSFESGTQTWTVEGEEFIAAYQRLDFNELTALGVMTKANAFGAVRSLVLRSVIIGVSMMLISMGLTLVFIRKLTQGLRHMAVATEKVSKGIFTFRVDTSTLGYDEIGSLARSFNMMADKIDELMQDTAAKVEFKNNKQTVDTVNSILFPSKDIKTANIGVAGASIASQVYGGDWFQYARIRDHVIFILAKVADRGLPAALMTAAVHGSFVTYTSTVQGDPKAAPTMKELMRVLNYAAYDAGKGKGRMAFVLGIVDTASGQMQVVNAGHTPPLLHRIGFGGRPDKDTERFSIITKKLYTAFGQAAEVTFEPEVFQLQKTDSVFMYTHGLTSVKNMKGEVMFATKDARQAFAQLYDEYKLQAPKIAENLLERSKKVWGKAAENLPDDASVLVITVPEDAYFMSLEKGKSKVKAETLKKAISA